MDSLDVKEILGYIVSKLVENPDDVVINEVRGDDNNVVLEVKVNPSDMGKVIGRQGRIAKEIRIIMKSVGQRSDARIDVSILD